MVMHFEHAVVNVPIGYRVVRNVIDIQIVPTTSWPRDDPHGFVWPMHRSVAIAPNLPKVYRSQSVFLRLPSPFCSPMSFEAVLNYQQSGTIDFDSTPASTLPRKRPPHTNKVRGIPMIS